MKHFARHLRDARRAARLSQTALAAAIGSHQPEISRWERGVGYPITPMLPAIAAALKTSVQHLVIGDQPEVNTVHPQDNLLQLLKDLQIAKLLEEFGTLDAESRSHVLHQVSLLAKLTRAGARGGGTPRRVETRPAAARSASGRSTPASANAAARSGPRGVAHATRKKAG